MIAITGRNVSIYSSDIIFMLRKPIVLFLHGVWPILHLLQVPLRGGKESQRNRVMRSEFEMTVRSQITCRGPAHMGGERTREV
jgi:hypothetical protein